MEGNRRDVHDVSGAARDHVRQHQLQAVVHTLEVDGLHLVPLLFGHSQERLTGVDAGIIDQNVDLAELLDGGIDCRSDLRGVADIAGEVLGPASRRAYGLGHRPISAGIPIQQKNASPLRGEQPGDGLADSCGGAGDEGGLVV
jgi:hypothetical protein